MDEEFEREIELSEGERSASDLAVAVNPERPSALAACSTCPDCKGTGLVKVRSGGVTLRVWCRKCDHKKC